jgi:potassium-dependent mechanosensitive channel
MRATSIKALIIGLGIILCLAVMVGQAGAQRAPEAQKASAGETSAAIPVAEVTTRATEVSDFLRTLYKQFAPSHEIEKILKELPEVSARIASENERTMKLLRAQPTLVMLQTEEQAWQRRQIEMGRWMSLLTQRAMQLQTALGRLADLQKAWGETLESARVGQAPETILQQISAVLPAIEAAQITMQTQHSALLELQGRVGKEAAQCGAALAEISQAQQTAVGGLGGRERLPIWSAERWAQAPAAGLARLHEVASDPWAEIEQYLHDPSSGMPVHLGFFALLSVLFYAMRRQVRRWTLGEGSPVMTIVSERPYAAALLASLLIASGPSSPAPATIRSLFEALAMAPIIRLIRPTVYQRLVIGLYTLGVLFALDNVRHALAGLTLLDQGMVVLEALAGMAVLGWSLAFGNLRKSLSGETGLARLRALRLAASFVFVILSAGLVTGVLGYVPVGRLLVSGVLIGGAVALALSASVRILCAVVAFGLRVWPLRLLHMVRDHRDLLERRTRRVLGWLAIVAWLVRVLDYVGLLEPTLSFGKTLLAVKLERGSISVSVEDVLAFVLTVWAAYLVSAFIRFVLEEDVYPRKNVPHGMAYAASRLLHYSILALGLVVGIGVLGVDLTKVTVLVGAFGVGLGFGLQDVVNNFVCGMILLFERPIHVGDMIEIGSLLGEVRRIGIRASTVRTAQGADIVMPNSQFITSNVTNWTLSDRLRRIDLPVGVNYSAPPQKVIQVIEAVATAHPKILRNPQPQVLFIGFGDSSINFELRAWTDQFNDWVGIRSELAVAVYDAVQGAGMSFPFPQREVRLLRDDKG